jgi:hypothetical protein
MEKIWEAVDTRDSAVNSAETAAMTAQTEYTSQDELSDCQSNDLAVDKVPYHDS